MSFNTTTGTYTPASGALTAAPGQVIASATWNGINTDYTDALTLLGQGWAAPRSRVTVQFDKTNDTLADITGLSITVVAAKAYSFEATLFTTANVAAGVKAAISGTATATSVIYEGYLINSSTVAGQTRATSLGTAVAGVTAVTAALVLIRGEIVVNAGGTLTVQFAQNATNAAASSVLVGSYFQASQIT